MWCMKYVIPLLLFAAPGFAQTCPEAPDHGEALSALFTEVQQAQTAADAQLVTNRMWELWATAPDGRAQAMLDRGLELRSQRAFSEAYEKFDQLIAYCPDYAEGYNQRAFVLFLSGEFQGAREDLEQALRLSPDHLAARAGLGLTLVGLGEKVEGLRILKEALAVNPWLPERRTVEVLEAEIAAEQPKEQEL